MLETMAKHIDKAIHVNSVLKCFIKLFLRITLTALFEQSPSNRLRGFYEGTESLNVKGIILDDSAFGIILKSSLITNISRFLPASFRRNQERFNVCFKLLFIVSHRIYSPF